MGEAKENPRHIRSSIKRGYFVALAESLEPRIFLSATTLAAKLLARIDAGLNAQGAASAPVIDVQGDVFVWSGSQIFELPAGSDKLQVVADLNSLPGPSGGGNWHGWGRLFLDRSGNLYGYQSNPYPNDVGEVFKWDHATSTLHVVMQFSVESTGAVPFGVTVDHDGNIFGTLLGSYYPSGSDSVFEVRAGTQSVITLASLGLLHWTPETQVAVDDVGNVFGIANGIGSASQPIVFEIKTGTTSLTQLASFNGSNGVSSDYAYGLAIDAQGNVYGQSNLVNENGRCIFQIKKDSGVITRVATFHDFGFAGFIVDPVGNIFTTDLWGAISTIPAGSHDLTTLMPSNSALGQQVGLALDSSGTLFAVGQTFFMSLPWGPYTPPTVPTLFKLVPQTDNHFQIDAPSSLQPADHLRITVRILDADGNLVTTNNSPITLSLASGPAGAVLGGTYTVNAANGIATFDDLSLTTPGNYTLAVNGPDMPTGFSANIHVQGDDYIVPFPGGLLPISITPPSDPQSSATPITSPEVSSSGSTPSTLPAGSTIASPILAEASPTPGITPVPTTAPVLVHIQIAAPVAPIAKIEFDTSGFMAYASAEQASESEYDAGDANNSLIVENITTVVVIEIS